MTHPRHRLDDLIHVPVRFSIMAALVPVDRVEFKTLRDVIEVSDSLLSKHMTVLAEAGYLTITKGSVGRRPRTWLSATDKGRKAFADHYTTLGEIMNSPRVDQDAT